MLPMLHGEPLQRLEGLERFGAQFSQSVVNARRDGGVAGAGDEAVTLKVAEAGRQGFLGDDANIALQFRPTEKLEVNLTGS